MFSLEETLTWTADDVFARIRSDLPSGWTFDHVLVGGWHRISLRDSEGTELWSGEHPDPRLLGLDALGWLSLRSHQVKHPAWKPREEEVPLYQPSKTIVSAVPDPPDLDPSEVDAVYRTSR